eukprot:CAMPEP_0177668838 /NCGR_PEP_ID=MMETSP0447-20121125/23035_1 /TAXON_ID=0 /ORGANISM="Stygamoeba regulata, Strain BSH-02190019" /LENGTH=1404 /DNA_ID=CAMNT_0019175493 /DNA_START=15 /DNA_END=4229 /DNA_ORIENTATION=+
MASSAKKKTTSKSKGDSSPAPKKKDAKPKGAKEEEEENVTPEADVGLRTLMPNVGYDDMTKMDDMTEELLLTNIRDRYHANVIYTYSTSILCAVNPYKQMKIYEPNVIKKYVGHRIGVQPPHLYAIAESAFTVMKDELTNISILVSGESGAGKTEGTKYVLRYLAARTSTTVAKIEQMLLATIPVLESMGNARTIRNHNSSRFGKYIKIQFDEQFNICGSKIKHYLLEKSRLCFQAEGERNFHVFYCMAAAPKEDKDRLFLDKKETYRYLNQSGTYDVPGLDEAHEWESLKKGLELFEVTNEDMWEMFSVLAAVLQLGNVEFSGEKATLVDKTSHYLEKASTLLKLERDSLLQGFRGKTMLVRGETVTVEFNSGQARDTADATAKALYAKLFDWMVRKLNEATFTTKYIARHFMGLLDIFGFEDLKTNSFEQLLINFANEKLQQFFNHFIFKQEQEEYEREGINWSKIQFKDNQECLDLIEKRPISLLALLDEECKFPKASDKTYVEKCTSNFANKHPNYEAFRMKPLCFKVNHYAGEVTYDTTTWLDKNRDELSQSLMDCIRSSKSHFVIDLFKERVKKSTEDKPKKEEKVTFGGAGKGKGKRRGGDEKLTCGAQFKNSLQKLMDMMANTRPYFVRCIKPNPRKKPDDFVEQDVMDQLRYAGMIETIRIRRMGYPIRYIHKDFFWRYKCLVDVKHWNETSHKASAGSLLPHLGIHPDHIQLGNTKVFMKQEVSNNLDDRRIAKLMVVIIRIQAWYKMRVKRNEYLRQKEAAAVIDDIWRMKERVDRLKRCQAAVLTMQCFWRVTKAKRALTRRKAEEAERRRKEEEERQRRIKEIGEKAFREEEAKKAQAMREAAMNKQAELNEKRSKQPKKPVEKKKVKKPKRRQPKGKEGPKFLPDKFSFGFGWSLPPLRHVDFDLCAMQFDESGSLLDVSYYNQLKSLDGSMVHKGDDRKGDTEKRTNEEITVVLSKMSPKVVAVAFAVTCYSDGYTWSYAKTAHYTIKDINGGMFEQFDFDTQVLGKTHNAMLVGFAGKREAEKWEFVKCGAPKNGKFFTNIVKSVQDELDGEGAINLPDEERPLPEYKTIKGEETPLPFSINRLMVGLGWLGKEDLDLSCLCFRFNELIETIDPVVHRTSKDGSVVHSGDRKVGSGKGDDERLYIDLKKVDNRITTLMILVNLFKCDTGGFNRVRNAYVRVLDDTNPKDRKNMFQFDLSEVGNRSAQITCKINRNGGKWDVTAMGEPSYGFYYEQMVPKMVPFLPVIPEVKRYQLTVHGEVGLCDLDAQDKNDPYWEAHFDQESYKSARIKRGNVKTVWEQSCELTGQTDAMDITVWNHSKLSKTFLGIAHVPLAPLIKQGKKINKENFPLQERGKKGDKTQISGSLTVSVIELKEGEVASKKKKKKA